MNPSGEYDGQGGRPASRRLHELLGMPVRFSDGGHAGYVNDVRLAPSDRLRGTLNQLVTDGLVVGSRRHGTLLGYDRRSEQGPLIVAAVVRAMHRHSGYVAWTSVRDIDFERGTVQLSVDSLGRLEEA